MTSPVSLADAVRQAILYQLGTIHTALPAAIISYDYTVQKASVQPLLNKVWASGPPQPMPILENVPVIFPRSGGASLTFPVNAGDTVLLVFVERSIDLWLTVGGQVDPDDPRKFDLSDAVAIPGLYPFSVNSEAVNNTDVLLTYNGSYLKIKENGDIVINTSGKVAIGNSLAEVLQILDQLLIDLQGPSVTGPTPNGPLSTAFVALANTLQIQLELIKGTIP